MHVHVLTHPEAGELARYSDARRVFLRHQAPGDALDSLTLPGTPSSVILPGLTLADLTHPGAHATQVYALRDIEARYHVMAQRLDLAASVAYHGRPSGAVYLTAPETGAELLSHVGPSAVFRHTPAGLLVAARDFRAPPRDLKVLWAALP